jgi:hypothetical protein
MDLAIGSGYTILISAISLFQANVVMRASKKRAHRSWKRLFCPNRVVDRVCFDPREQFKLFTIWILCVYEPLNVDQHEITKRLPFLTPVLRAETWHRICAAGQIL